MTDRQPDWQILHPAGWTSPKGYREVLGRNFPAMTAMQVCGLIEDAARVEIEATAVIPD